MCAGDNCPVCIRGNNQNTLFACMVGFNMIHLFNVFLCENWLLWTVIYDKYSDL